MNHRSNGHSSCCGLTLIEVVAALVLMGTLLVGIVMARGKHTRQLALADERLAAIAAADNLLASWWAEPASLPRSGSGTVPGRPTWRWSIESVENESIEQLGAAIVRLTLHGNRPAPLVSVDLAVPVESSATDSHTLEVGTR